MGRRKHEFWQFVEGTNDAWECKFCEHKGSGASRVRAHLLGEKGKGIAICENVPKKIKDATAGNAGERDNNVTAGSSDLQGDPNKGTYVTLS